MYLLTLVPDPDGLAPNTDHTHECIAAGLLVGGDPAGVARAQGKLLDYGEWQNLCELAQTNETLKKQLKNLVNTYYMVKDT